MFDQAGAAELVVMRHSVSEGEREREWGGGGTVSDGESKLVIFATL